MFNIFKRCNHKWYLYTIRKKDDDKYSFQIYKICKICKKKKLIFKDRDFAYREGRDDMLLKTLKILETEYPEQIY